MIILVGVFVAVISIYFANKYKPNKQELLKNQRQKNQEKEARKQVILEKRKGLEQKLANTATRKIIENLQPDDKKLLQDFAKQRGKTADQAIKQLSVQSFLYCIIFLGLISFIVIVFILVVQQQDKAKMLSIIKWAANKTFPRAFNQQL